MDFKEALSYINLGNCVLFVGSGFSMGATNLSGTKLPNGADLTKLLYDECKEPSEGGDLQDASNLYINQNGITAFINLLKGLFTIKEYKDITSEQKFITSLPWKRVYTTNYDNIIELGCEYHEKKIQSKVLSDGLVKIKDKTKLCIHLNGYISRLDETSLDKEFKLTDQSYTSEDFISSDWITLFDSDLKTADAIFFIGFSMNSDLDIKRVINRDPETFQKSYFIVWDQEKPPVIRTLENYGQVLPINVSGFVETYQHITPRAIRLEERYRCFDIVKYESPNHADIMDKLMGLDKEASGRTSGNGFYYLMGDIARLSSAMLSYARDYMIDQGFIYCIPPFMIRSDVVTGVMSFEEMGAMMYKIEGEDLYLIGTSEHSMIGKFKGQILPKQELPYTMTSYSPCFRKEKGAHGIEERGI